MTVDMIQQSQGFFERAEQSASAILPLQTDPSLPEITGLSVATSMVLPDKALGTRLAHFPSDLYDLRETSHLRRFLATLIGDAGVGQLRKRNIFTQYQSALDSTHFYDLDRFYGAIFGLLRTTAELLPINPHTSTATASEWDEIDLRDATFRARIKKLASAINLGATYPGIKAAAEAITQAECEVYEVWSLLDTYGSATMGKVWDDIEALGSYDDIEGISPSPSVPTWDDLLDQVTIGRTGVNNRSEVIVYPKKDYDRIAFEDGEREAAIQKAEDVAALVRVLSVLKPASVLITVDPDGLAMHRDATITNLVADSNYWEVTTRVTPRPGLQLSPANPYPRSLQQQLLGLLTGERREIPKPPLSVQQAAEWSFNPEIVSVRSYTYDPKRGDRSAPRTGPITDRRTDDLVTYTDGTRETFTADRGILDPRRALAARYAADGILIAHPFASDRKAVPPNG